MRRVFLDDDRTEELVSSEVGNISTPQFSPDGKWISYSKPDSLLRSHVYVKPLAGGEERRVELESEEASFKALQAGFKAADYDMRELLVALTKTRAFTHRALSEGEVTR